MLYFGRQILIPLALSLVLGFLLTPFAGLLERCRLGRVPSVLTVLVLCFALTGFGAWVITGQLVEIMAHIGDYKSNLEDKIHSLHPPKDGTLSQATATVRELNKELAAVPGEISALPAHGSNGLHGAGGPSRPVPVQVTAPPSNLYQDLRDLLGPLAGPLETGAIVVIFTAFMLIKREDLRNRLIRLGGHGRLNVMTQALDDANHRLSRYLMLQFLVNAGYGILFGLGLYFVGVPNALLWGALGSLLRLVPYVGTLIATAFPMALALAVFPGWKQVWLILGLFLVLELIVGNVVEPLLYGAHTGISSLAILVAAVFWATLWGPVGLILSTPLTVCLMLLGRNVPQLEFLEVALGDEPVLGPEEKFYQRLLAADQEDARTIAESHLQEEDLETLYESVLIPALKLAEEDRHRDALEQHTCEFIYQSTRELIEDLGDRRVRPPSSGAIVCVPARDEADELVAMMLTQLLQQTGKGASYLAIGAVDDMLAQVSQNGSHIVCVSALPPFAVGQARSLCKRLRAAFPDLRIVLALWDFDGGPPKAQKRVGPGCTDAVTTTLSDALVQIQRLLDPISVDPATTIAAEPAETNTSSAAAR